MQESESISLAQVATHNLKNIDVMFPLGRYTVVTGVSGSGKSSLVFDTLYGESYRRYVESLSSFARQYLKALPKPVIGEVSNLPPAIAVRQTRANATSRSTVGTMSEVNDLLRIIFAQLADVFCPGCGEKVVKDSGETVAQKCVEEFTDQRVYMLSSLRQWGKLSAKDLKIQLQTQGFTRILLRGEVKRTDDVKIGELKNAEVVIDRIAVNKDSYQRLADSAELALKLGRGEVIVATEAGDRRRAFVSSYSCANCQRDFLEPSLALFSFNHPYGACPTCQGFGMEATLDWDKVFPKKEKSLKDEGVVVWNFGSHTHMYDLAKVSAKALKISFNKPFSEYSAQEWQWLKKGDGKRFIGVQGYYDWVLSKRHKAHYRIHAARFRKYVICTACSGGRLNANALACRIGGENFAQVCTKNVALLNDWLAAIDGKQGKVASAEKTMGVREAVEELQARVRYLIRIGLKYLSIDRPTRTLSGGEQQRINMARCLGSALTDTLYCLDEPTSGLHARDSLNLLNVIYELRDQGNTVVVVEHERTLIDGSDHLIEIGPDAGHKGGEVVYVGKPRRLRGTTAEYPAAASEALAALPALELRGARTHNLRGVDARFPLHKFTAVCGVSGSGKTSLIQHTLFPLLARELGQPVDGQSAEPLAASLGPARAINAHSAVILVSQQAVGRSTRSNIATYLGIFEEIRKLLAASPLAKKYGLTASSFSFNSPGGRCEGCRGLGTVMEDLSFLGEMAVICPSCLGKRFDDKVLEVDYKGAALPAILEMTVAEARAHFFERPHLVKILDTIAAMGLGYVRLGQNTNSFSGGEAQRLKLIRLMLDAEVKDAKPKILIFDEPTTGLSDRDVRNLVEQFFKLTAIGHTVIVVEHHLGVLEASDWLIEVGPDAAAEGGEVVYQGPPAGIKDVPRSKTAPFLWRYE